MASPAALRVALRRAALSSPVRSTFRPLNGRTSAAPLSKRCFSYSSPSLAKRYSKDHEWIEVSDDGASATVGISTYAADSMGDVVYIELPEEDTEFGAGDTIGAVESVKSASDILAPVAGSVIEVNTTLEETPGEINRSPESESWLFKIKLADPDEVNGLMDESSYTSFTQSIKKD